MKKTEIKICGITTQEEMRWLIDEKAEYAGVILFYEKSKRFSTLEQASRILEVVKYAQVAEKPKMVAVCMNPTLKQAKIIEEMGFDFLQVHGKLPVEILESCTIPIIRAISFQDLYDIPAQFEKRIAGILYDSCKPGSGETYDWSLFLQKRKQTESDRDKKFILAGGLNPENVREAIRILHPDIVDVSSGVEQPEKQGKDKEKIEEFIREVRWNES